MRDYTNYNSSSSFQYKQGRIFCAYFGSNEVIRVCVDQWAYAIEVKSIRSAKIMITKHYKKYGGGKWTLKFTNF